MKQVLVISSAETPHNKQIVADFVDNLNKMSQDTYNCVNIHYDDIGFEFGDQIRVFSLVSGADIASYDFVYFKSYIRYEERALALAIVLKKFGTPFVCSEVEYGLSTSKLSQYALLAAGELPLPKTLFIPSKRLPESYDTFASALSIPFVLKATDGKGGEANYLIANRDEFTSSVAEHSGVEFVGQSFIANSGDLRVLVVNGAIKLIIGRARKDDSTHLNNTSQGANARLLDASELSDEAKSLSLKAAQILKREIAGVDVMFEEGTDKPYILEVNASPQVGSGAFTEEKLSVYHDFIVEVLQNN